MTTQRTAITARRRLNRRELGRVALWGLSTAVALLVMVFVANSGSGPDRLAAAATKIHGDVVARRSQPEDDTRKLTEALQLLAADRDRLATRLDALERNLGEMTGSIERQITAATAPRPTAAPPLPTIALPAVTSSAPLQTPIVPAELGRQPFGIDLGSAVNVEGLRALWAAAKTKHGGLLEGLHPIVAIREPARPGRPELRLVVGPIPSAAAASRLCSLIAASGAVCQAAAFEGQRLALR